MDAHVSSLDGERDEVRRLGIVHLDRAAEAARELRRHELLDLALGRASRQAAGDEDRRAAPREYRARSSSSIATASAAARGSTGVPGIGCAVGSMTTVARPPRGTRLSSGSPASGKRSESRTAAATSATGIARRRRREHDRVVVRIDDGDPRPGEERDAGQGSARYSRRNVVLKPRFGQKREASRFVTRQSVIIVV